MPTFIHRLLWQRISTRLGLAFGALLAVSLVGVVLATSRLNELAQTYAQLVADQYAVATQVETASHNADTAVRKMLVVAASPRQAREQAYAAIDVSNALLDRALDGLRGRSIDGDQGATAAAVLQRLQVYRQAYIDTADLVEADDLLAARTLIGERVEPALNGLAEALAALAGRQHAAYTRQSGALQARIVRDRQLLWALSGAALALGGLLSWGVARSIVRPLQKAEAGGLLLAQGQYQHRLAVSGVDEVSRVSGVLNTLAQAVSEREQQLLRMVHTDHLTGLAQRPRFLAEAHDRLAALRPTGGQALLVCVDVDRLKHVNAVLGFDAGDAVLKHAAQRLQDLFGDTALTGRLGGGTFVLLLPLEGGADSAAVGLRTQQALEYPLDWRGNSVDLAVTVGMALFPQHADAAESLLRKAEQAMFEGKRQHLSPLLHSPSTEASRRSQLSLLSDLQTAIQDGQLRQFLQPKVSPHDGRVLGAEALVRWEHPKRGWLPPSDFIPFAEASGRIRQVTQWMLEQAVQTLARWQQRGWDLTLAINVSTLDLQDATLAHRVAATLRQHGVLPQRLQLELTETGLMASGPDPVQMLHALHAVGVGLSIDDFGTGHSSLAYLQRLPVNELKIDRSFVDGVDGDARRQSLLRAIVDMGHSLGLEVTAEGVETAAEMAVLQQAGCDLVQGYRVAKPMATAAFMGWYAERAGAVGVNSKAAQPAGPVVQPAAAPASA